MSNHIIWIIWTHLLQFAAHYLSVFPIPFKWTYFFFYLYFCWLFSFRTLNSALKTFYKSDRNMCKSTKNMPYLQTGWMCKKGIVQETTKTPGHSEGVTSFSKRDGTTGTSPPEAEILKMPIICKKEEMTPWDPQITSSSPQLGFESLSMDSRNRSRNRSRVLPTAGTWSTLCWERGERHQQFMDNRHRK